MPKPLPKWLRDLLKEEARAWAFCILIICAWLLLRASL